MPNTSDPAPRPQAYLPDGTPLFFSLEIEAHFLAFFGIEGLGYLPRISSTYQAYVLLWMCAHPQLDPEGRAAWEELGVSISGDTLPLYLRRNALIETALKWFSARFAPGDAAGHLIVANFIWTGGTAPPPGPHAFEPIAPQGSN